MLTLHKSPYSKSSQSRFKLWRVKYCLFDPYRKSVRTPNLIWSDGADAKIHSGIFKNSVDFCIIYLIAFHNTFHLKGSAKFFVVVKSNVLSFPFLVCLNFCHSLGNKLMLKLSTMTLWHIPPSCPQIWTQHFPQTHVFFLQNMGSNADTNKMWDSERGSPMCFPLLPGGKEGFECRQPHPLPSTLQIERSAHKLVNSMLRPLLVGHSIPPSPNTSWEL